MDSKGEVVASATGFPLRDPDWSWGPWKDTNCRSGPSCQDWEGLEEGPGTLEPPLSTQHLETIKKRVLSRLSQNLSY